MKYGGRYAWAQRATGKTLALIQIWDFCHQAIIIYYPHDFNLISYLRGVFVVSKSQPIFELNGCCRTDVWVCAGLISLQQQSDKVSVFLSYITLTLCERSMSNVKFTFIAAILGGRSSFQAAGCLWKHEGPSDLLSAPTFSTYPHFSTCSKLTLPQLFIVFAEIYDDRTKLVLNLIESISD